MNYVLNFFSFANSASEALIYLGRSMEGEMASPASKNPSCQDRPVGSPGQMVGRGSKNSLVAEPFDYQLAVRKRPFADKYRGAIKPLQKISGRSDTIFHQLIRQVPTVVESRIDLLFFRVKHRAYRMGCPRYIHGQHGQGGKAADRLFRRKRESLSRGDSHTEPGKGAGSQGYADPVKVVYGKTC